MKINKQLLLTHGILVFLCVLIVFINIIAHKGMQDDSIGINGAGKLRALSYNMIHLSNQIHNDPNNNNDDLKSTLSLKIDEFDSILEMLLGSGKKSNIKIKSSEITQKLKHISEEWNKDFKPSYLEVLEGELSNENYLRINTEIGSYVNSIDEMMTEYSNYSRQKSVKSIKVNAALVLLIVGVTIYSFRATNNKIKLPIQALTKELKELSLIDEEVSQRIKNIDSDEISEMSEYFNAMMYDQLTKAFNRRAGLSKLSKILNCKDESCYRVSLCFVDVNGLKEVNDKLGHEAGDELIVNVVEGIKKEIRNEDFVIRMGGDEFLIVLKDIDEENAERFWTRIKLRYEKMNQTNGKNYIISVSHGIVESKANEKLDMDSLIKKADGKMYIEKKYIKEELKIKSIRE